MITKWFLSHAFIRGAHCHACFSVCVCVWSNFSVCRGAAGNCRFLLRVHPKEQAVCHRSRRSASYSQQTGADRLCTCEFITMNINDTSKLSQLYLFIAVISWNVPTTQPLNHPDSSRMCPATLGCNQQESDCSNSGHLPPPLLFHRSPLDLSVSTPFQWGRMHHLDMAAGYHGNTGSRCCGNRLFMISSNEIASNTSLQLSLSMLCVWETEEGRGLSGRM